MTVKDFQPSRREVIATVVIFCLVLAWHVRMASVGWTSLNLPGNEFRQTQTAISAFFIQKDHDFSIAYPTPVLGKPWSIPMEFPLYVWSVVAASNITGLPLTEAGRAVSLACFYLALPAIFLLLGWWGLARSRRLVVLGLVLTCPLYIFYVRAFLIETMALMFSLWFLLAFGEAIRRRSVPWLILANLAGVAAGLAKVTTFMLYLMPAGVWAFCWLWRAWPRRRGGSWPEFGRVFGWLAMATALPFAASYWWVKYADIIKARNPAADFLLSGNLTDFNFGTWAAHFSGAVWRDHLAIVFSCLASAAVVIACLALGACFAGRWRRLSLWCVGFFFGVQMLFPTLYAIHDYYYVSNAALLMVAGGLVLCGLLESRLPRWLAWAVILLVLAAQGRTYYRGYYQVQRIWTPGGSGLTEAMKAFTAPDDVLVVAGDDWSSLIPYYSQRRALMIRRDHESSWDYDKRAFRDLQGEFVAAFMLKDKQRGNRGLLNLADTMLGIDPRPAMVWQDTVVYLNRRIRPEIIQKLKYQTNHFANVVLAPGAESSANLLVKREVLVDSLLPRYTTMFAAMTPRPWKYYSTFGAGAHWDDGVLRFDAHPDTRLWFKPPAGARRIRAQFGIAPGAYEQPGTPTDGVEFEVVEEKADGSRQRLYDRLLNPHAVPADRGTQELDLAIHLPADAAVVFITGPGPNKDYNRDWAYWGRIVIE